MLTHLIGPNHCRFNATFTETGPNAIKTVDELSMTSNAWGTPSLRMNDEGITLAAVSTMYRLLHSVDQVRERRTHSVHPASVKPELVAHGPNVWSWDIAKLHGPAKWTYFYLYVILDIYSR